MNRRGPGRMLSSRARFVVWVTAGLLGLLPHASPAVRPNVVLIMTDDQGYGDFGLHGNPQVRTPVLDRFAREGIQFERFYVSPLCAPTRASLLTGRYSQRTGVWGVTHNKEAMRPEEVTLAEVLKSAGYRTGLFGKWHNGEQFPYTPTGQGFEEFFGFHNGHWNNYHDPMLLRGTRAEATKGFIADVLTDEALRFVERQRARPFFCYLAYNTPHSPYQAPPELFERYRARGLNEELAAIYAMCENVDTNVGRLLARLDALQLRERTLVLFLTDNGPQTDRFNAGMRGRKGSVHEGGTRVPLFVQWPGALRAPRVVTRIAAHLDLMPTLLDLCDVPPPSGAAFDGRSLRPLLEGREADWPERMLFTQNTPGAQTPGPVPGAVRTQRYRAVLEARGWQLYDMVADPAQQRDLAGEQSAMLATLRGAYEQWWQEVSRRGFERFPLPVGHREENPVTLHAPQAYFSGGVQFQGRNGFAHDWLVGWTRAEDRVWWELEVAHAGAYEVSLRYLIPGTNGSARVRVAAGTAAQEIPLMGGPIREHSLRHLAGTSNTYRNLDWLRSTPASLQLPRGRMRLELSLSALTGPEGIWMKGMELRRKD